MKKQYEELNIDELVGNPTNAICVKLDRLDGLGNYLTIGKEYRIIHIIYGKTTVIKIKHDRNRFAYFSTTSFKLK